MTPQTAIVYSRDQLLMLQNHAVLLNHGQSSMISQLRLRRRGCRAGAHLRRRLRAADCATFAADYMTTPGEIPVIIGQQAETVNKKSAVPRSARLPRVCVASSVRCQFNNYTIVFVAVDVRTTTGNCFAQRYRCFQRFSIDQQRRGTHSGLPSSNITPDNDDGSYRYWSRQVNTVTTNYLFHSERGQLTRFLKRFDCFIECF